MNLLIDIGNTRIKFAIASDQIVETGFLPEFSEIEIDKLIRQKGGFNSCIVSAVRDLDQCMINNIKTRFSNFLILDENTMIPVKNNYQSKSSLGKDRLAAIVGAHNIFNKSHVLVIDFGTAVTFDLLEGENGYMGGTISPGLSTRFRALNEFTGKLPLFDKKETDLFIGTDTESAIITGVQNGMIFETQGYISYLEKKYPGLKVILTGGDADFFAKYLKSTIFAEPNLVFIGLNTILQYNA